MHLEQIKQNFIDKIYFNVLSKFLFFCPTYYNTKNTIYRRFQIRKKWLEISNSKPKLLFTAWLGENKTHRSLYGATRTIWESSLFSTIILGTPLPNDLFPRCLIEYMPEFLRSDSKYIYDMNFINFIKKFTHFVPYQFLENSIIAYKKDFNIEQDVAYAYASGVYLYYMNALSFYKPDIVCMLAWQPAHRILRKICEEKNIPYFFAEYGVLDGTYTFDFNGSMGESWVSKYHEFFNTLPLEKNDIRTAKEFLTATNNNQYSRNIDYRQSQEAVLELQRVKNNGKKIILFAGSNDAHSGNTPYDENARKYHAPYYKDNEEILEALCQFSSIEPVTLIYKKHPITSTRKNYIFYNPENLITITSCDFRTLALFCDLCIVNVSQSAYVALQNNVPVLMLGINQLYWSGAVYKISNYRSLSQAIKSALEFGFTEVQRNAFINHAARLIKYYLYSFHTNYGRKISCIPSDIMGIINGSYLPHHQYEFMKYKSFSSKNI